MTADNVRPLRTVTWAAENGTLRDLLVALRERLWAALNDERTQPRDLSPITLRLKELQHEIEAIDARQELENSLAAEPREERFFDPSSI